MKAQRPSFCKVNFLLNILGRRSDGFHELETVMHPVAWCDTLEFEQADDAEVHLTCSDPGLATDGTNLVHRAATRFLELAAVRSGVRIHLEKRIPVAAGLGGGSGNAASTLLGLNELFGSPLSSSQLHGIAAGLGSDIPFFLQPYPALATGRGEQIAPLPFFSALRGAFLLLIYPGFGISTAWAYQQLARFPATLNGEKGRAQRLIALLQAGDLAAAARAFYNSLEAPALLKYPLLQMYQEFLREGGAIATLMSGSGSATFAIASDEETARRLEMGFREKFGPTAWLAVVPITSA